MSNNNSDQHNPTTPSNEELIEARVCPNCWGQQEYDNIFIKKVKDPTRDNVNHLKTNRKAFIRQFVETHVSGIHLKTEGQKLTCEGCNHSKTMS